MTRSETTTQETARHEVPLRERKKARTREAIIDAALDLFERNGFDRTTVEDIAAAADVSPRTFFRYFDSKLDVVMARNKTEDDKFDEFVQVLAGAENPIEATRQLIRDRFAALSDHEMASETRELKVCLSTPSLRGMTREHFHEHQAPLARMYATALGLDEDSLCAHLLASMVSVTMWTVLERWVAEGGKPDRLLVMVDEAFDLLSSGLR